MSGLLALILAYLLWGLFPLFWKTLTFVPADELLFLRIFWSWATVLVVLHFRGTLKTLWSHFSSRDTLVRSVGAAICLGGNWYAFLWTMGANRILESSMGYFLCPLFSVVWGKLIFREHLSLPRKAAVLFAFAGVAWMIFLAHRVPLAAVLIALSWSLYGALKKTTKTGPFTSLAMESTLLLPVALLFYGLYHAGGRAVTQPGHLLESAHLATMGAVTLLPLLLYAYAAPRIALSTLGLFQFIVPTMLFILAVGIYDEPMDAKILIGFGLIWIGIALYQTGKKQPKELMQKTL